MRFTERGSVLGISLLNVFVRCYGTCRRIEGLTVLCDLGIVTDLLAGSRTESMFLYKFDEAIATDSFTEANRMIGSGRPNYVWSRPDEDG